MPQHVDAEDAADRLEDLVERTAAGEEFIAERDGSPIALLTC